MLYNWGIDAYSERRWHECTSLMYRAIEDYKFYQKTLINCHRKCHGLEKTSQADNVTYDNLLFQNFMRLSFCIDRCKMKTFGDVRPQQANPTINSEFKKLKPYDYLQLCTFRLERYEEAASSAYTYLLANPDDESTQKNIHYYRKLPQISDDFFKNKEEQPHQAHYIKAVLSYNEKDWLSVIKNMESATEQYYNADEGCHYLCEDTGNRAPQTNIYSTITDHMNQMFQCQYNCSNDLDRIYGKKMEDFLADCYHYLQFAYFKVGDFLNAVQCAETFLLFNPNDKEMKLNKEIYVKQYNVEEDSFRPREVATKYMKMRTEIKQLLDARRKQVTTNQTGRYRDETLRPATYTTQELQKHDLISANNKNIKHYLNKRGIQLVAQGEELGGKGRFVADGLLTDEQCKDLIELANSGSITSDGYRIPEGTSPHTPHERFQGMTVDRAVNLARHKQAKSSQAHLYLDIAEVGRDFVEKYENVSSDLFFHYTHLVCRTSVDDQLVRNDFSHPVHADNCLLQDDGSCEKRRPAYVWRDYSSVLYLNDNFEGGDFFFANPDQSVQKFVKPKCGRIVAFASSDYHGVTAVTKGQRCAVAVWYTLDSGYREAAHVIAKHSLKSLGNQDDDDIIMTIANHDQVLKLTRHVAANKVNRREETNNTSKPAANLSDGVVVVMDEQDLDGPLRFAADNLATREQCQNLIALANVSSNVSHDVRYLDEDGDDVMSPGLKMRHVIKLAKEGLVSAESVQLYLDLAEKGKKITAEYFKLDKPLYFDFTHLVCRTALDNQEGRQDLSHPIHADNCYIQSDLTCKKELPAYIQRDYSAILYLNDDFEGGKFLFAHQNFTVQATVSPKCGRLVAFDSSTYHGVKAVTRGQRCAIAMWYTLDPYYNEKAHGQARKVLRDIEGKILGPPVHGEL